MARSAEDYGVPDLSEATLQELASNPKKYGEKSKFAQRELAGRKGVAATTEQYTSQAAKALPSLYAPAYSAISEQVQPQFAQARNYLAANPYAARSGVANSLNRRILTGAFSRLGQSMGETSAGVARGGIDLMGDLIRRRTEARYAQAQQEREARANKPGFLEQALGVAGAVTPFLPSKKKAG